MPRYLSLLAMSALLTIGLGCGDDGGGGSTDGGTTPDGSGGDGSTADDGGGEVSCPATAPMPDELMGACCYRKSNADRQDNPELRLADVALSQPSTLANVVVRGVFQGALDEERFNWLIRVGISGTSATIETGFGARNADGSFSFQSGTAPGGDPNRWDPVMVTGTVSGETVMSPTVMGALTLPVFDENSMPTLELPLYALSLDMMTLSEDRSCVGRRTGNQYDTSAGNVTAYVRVEDAKGVDVEVGPLMTTLCNFTSGADCEADAQSTWAEKPDSLCDATSCTQGACDQDTECNAWQIKGGFAAQGVEITD